jgi:ribosome biogenesis protein Tsr3
MIRECFPFLYKLRLFGNKNGDVNYGDISKLNCIHTKDIDATDATTEVAGYVSSESYNSNIIIIRYNTSNSQNDNNDSNISDIIEIQDSLIGNRKWIKQFKSANDNYKHINKDIVREYSSLSRSASLSSLEDNFDKSSRDIFRVSIDNVNGPIIQKIKNTTSITSA